MLKSGISFTGLIVNANVWFADVSTPLFSVPPLSCTFIVTVASPNASAAGVYVSFPFASINGCTEKRSVLVLFTTLKPKSVCSDSFSGPGSKPVAQPVTSPAPESSFTVWSLPLVKSGISFTGRTLTFTVPTAVPPLPSAIV